MTSHQLVQLGTLSTFQDRTRISFAGPTIHHPRILSLISGTLQGTASRRNKSQQASYLHTDTGTFEVAMRRSRKQKSWKRTAIKTATDSFRGFLSGSRSDLPHVQCFFRTFSGCLMAVFAVTRWKINTYNGTNFRAIRSLPGIHPPL